MLTVQAHAAIETAKARSCDFHLSDQWTVFNESVALMADAAAKVPAADVPLPVIFDKDSKESCRGFKEAASRLEKAWDRLVNVQELASGKGPGSGFGFDSIGKSGATCVEELRLQMADVEEKIYSMSKALSRFQGHCRRLSNNGARDISFKTTPAGVKVVKVDLTDPNERMNFGY
jgi:hypothetical protein